MKTATLFEIKRHTVTLLRGRDYIERYRHDGTIRPLDSGDALVSVRCEQLPVARISKIEHGVQKNHYIALDPELREILEAPFTARIASLDVYCTQAERRAEGLSAEVDALQMIINTFNNLPWYRRIFAKV